MLLLSLFFSISSFAQSYITKSTAPVSPYSNSAIYQTSANLVGIGTTSPTANLSIASASNSTPTILNVLNGTTSTPYSSLPTSFSIVRSGYITIGGNNYPGTTTDFIINSSGQVGIGTASPAYTLDVAGNLHTTGYAYVAGIEVTAASYFSGNVGIGTTSPDYPLDVQSGIVRIGNVTTPNQYSSSNTSGYSLYVVGAVLAEGYKCAIPTSSSWSDYVFDRDYRLAPLSEVESYIKDKHHLPGVPSADEVCEDGIDMAQMDATLLKKVEELTLYMLKLEKDNEVMKAEIANIKK